MEEVSDDRGEDPHGRQQDQAPDDDHRQGGLGGFLDSVLEVRQGIGDSQMVQRDKHVVGEGCYRQDAELRRRQRSGKHQEHDSLRDPGSPGAER